MKKILFSLLCFSLFAFVGNVGAQKQMTKQEQKEWKKTAKEYSKNPQALAQLTKDKQELQRVNNNLESEMNLVRTQLNAKDNRIANLESQVDQLNLELMAAYESEPVPPSFTATENAGEVIPMGTIFRVQIGAFEQDKNKIPSGLSTAPGMSLEKDGGLQKVVLGQFTSREEAEKLQKHLRKVGLKDAWIVTYKDGVRQ
jgi:cell division protein FtsB